MQIHELKSKNKRVRAVRIGRGGKRGKTSGKGTKGQNARAGRKFRPAMRDMIKKLPKLRGYRFDRFGYGNFRQGFSVVNLGSISESFSAGEIVNPAALLKKGLIRRVGGKIWTVKILASGQLEKKLNFQGCLFSTSAKEAVIAAGSQIDN